MPLPVELPLLLGFVDIGPGEMLLLGIVALLLFGSKLPEVGRTLGKGMAEFKRGMLGLAEEDSPAKPSRGGLPGWRRSVDEEIDDYIAPSAPKFEPPTAEPPVPNQDAGVQPSGCEVGVQPSGCKETV